MLHRSVPVAAVVVEFAGGVGSWVTRTYTATKGGGAFLNGKPINVSSTEALQRSLLVNTQPQRAQLHSGDAMSEYGSKPRAD